MAVTGAGGTPTCVSWLLLATNAVVLGLGGVGIWLSVINFGYEEALPPIPPSENTTTTTTTPDYSGYNYRHNSRIPQAYRSYVSQSQAFARVTDDVRFYLAPLSCVCAVVAGFTLLAGLFSRRLFTSTFSLYSSLGLWILTLVMTIMYQSYLAWNELPFDQYVAGLVLGCHISLLIFLPIQMLLCMWELRRQETKDWPTINFLNVFTVEAILLASRLTLIVFTFMTLFDSNIFRGLRGVQDRYNDYYESPRIRYPLRFSFLCFAAASYSAVATLETTLSMLLGKVHHRMTVLTCLLSGICCVIIAVLSSPVFVKVFIGPYYLYPTMMSFSISLSVVTFLHWLAYLFIPSSLRTYPSILTQIIDILRQVTPLDNITAAIRTQRMRGLQFLPKNMKYGVHIQAASLIFSIISIPIIGVAMGDVPSFRSWGHVLVLCANVATVIQILPPLVMEHLHEEKESIPVKQRLIGFAMETTLLLVGSITVCVNSYYGLGVFGGVLNIFFAAFQGLVMWSLVSEKLSKDQQSADTEHLTSNDEVTSQDDDDQNILVDAMA